MFISKINIGINSGVSLKTGHDLGRSVLGLDLGSEASELWNLLEARLKPTLESVSQNRKCKAVWEEK